MGAMYKEIDCTKLDGNKSHIYDSTYSLIERKVSQLTHRNPSLNKMELHLKARHNYAVARLILADGTHRQIEVDCKGRDLLPAISECFTKAQRVLKKPKHLKSSSAALRS